MAKKSLKVKQQRPQKYATREYNRCKICGRPVSYTHLTLPTKA